MRQLFYILTVFSTLTTLSSCGLDCVDNKTGEHKSSQTMKESKDKNVFQFEMQSNKNNFQLNKERIFKIKNAWVENGWMYDCVDNKAVFKKDTSLQFIIDGEYIATGDSLDYVLMSTNGVGNFLGAQLSFRYSKQDTFALTLLYDPLLGDKNKVVIDTLKFWKTGFTKN